MMASNKIHSFRTSSRVQVMSAIRSSQHIKARRILHTVWFVMGLVPLLLQVRSYLKFATPHKITETVLAPPGTPKQVANLTDLCPAQGMLLSEAWWNMDSSYYYIVEHGRVCHYVLPQYNVHGNYVIGNAKVSPFRTTPTDCAEDSYPFEAYFYHGSVGYYSFYIELAGTYCTKDKNAYIVGQGLGAFDINGSRLTNDEGSDDYRMSYWYSLLGVLWITYRALVLRRSYILCKRYGRRCEQMGEGLQRRQAVVFVQESLRLSAHGATNYHRAGLLFLLLEGIMSDLFLLIANDGLAVKLQYASLGYNISGLMLMLFEVVENANILPEKWRLFIKRLLFCYESTMAGEMATTVALDHFITRINHSDIKHSNPTAIEVSYYLWSLVGHGILVLVIVANIIFVRVMLAVIVVWWKHRSLAVFTAPCCVDSALGIHSRMTMLTGYRLDHGNLYYSPRASKAFGLLKMEEEDGAEFLILHKLYWLTVPRDNLYVIGAISGHRVESCTERACSGVVSFLDRSLGGKPAVTTHRHRRSIFVQTKSRVSIGPVVLSRLRPETHS